MRVTRRRLIIHTRNRPALLAILKTHYPRSVTKYLYHHTVIHRAQRYPIRTEVMQIEEQMKKVSSYRWAMLAEEGGCRKGGCIVVLGVMAIIGWCR